MNPLHQPIQRSPKIVYWVNKVPWYSFAINLSSNSICQPSMDGEYGGYGKTAAKCKTFVKPQFYYGFS